MSTAQSVEATGHAGRDPGQGPFLRLRLTVCNRVITAATYETYSCPACQSCGEKLCALLIGLPIAKAAQIDRARLEEKVGPLPRAKQQCFELALEALEDALATIGTPAVGPGE